MEASQFVKSGNILYWLIMVLLLSCVNQVTCLQCYTCSEEDTNENCFGSNSVQTCSRTQDRCLTQTIYSNERGKLRIDKSCASQLGCTEAETQLGKKYFCDKSRNGWGCVECCDQDRCNESSGVRIKVSMTVVLAIAWTVGLFVTFIR